MGNINAALIRRTQDLMSRLNDVGAASSSADVTSSAPALNSIPQGSLEDIVTDIYQKIGTINIGDFVDFENTFDANN